MHQESLEKTWMKLSNITMKKKAAVKKLIYGDNFHTTPKVNIFKENEQISGCPEATRKQIYTWGKILLSIIDF